MRRVLLDAGPLVLFLIGSLRSDLVGNHGKLSGYNLATFHALCDYLEGFQAHVSLPNVLTEASNHIGAGKQVICEGAHFRLAEYIDKLDEIYCPSREVVSIPEYQSVGLSDAAILTSAPAFIQSQTAVVTQDFELYNRLHGVGVECVNIMHWRTPARWKL